MSDDRLYGQPDDEHLSVDPEEAIERAVDRHAWAGATVSEGFTFEISVTEFSVMEKGVTPGSSIPDGADIIAQILERFGDDCGMEELWEDYERIGSHPDVVAAFQAARDLLVSKQRWFYADKEIATVKYVVTITDDQGHWTYEEAS